MVNNGMGHLVISATSEDRRSVADLEIIANKKKREGAYIYISLSLSLAKILNFTPVISPPG